MHRWTVLMLMVVLGAGMSLAQDPAETDNAKPSPQERREVLRERIRRAMQLPRTTEESRQEGADEEVVQEVLRTGRERGVPAGEMQEILEAENEELRAGRKDNFGGSVQEMKASGLRGRELADAIHAEQVARGMKKPKHKDKYKSKDHAGYSDEGGDARSGDEHADRLARERPAKHEEAVDRTKDRASDKAKGKGKGKPQGKGKNRGDRP